MKFDDMIPIKEFAEMHGLDPSSVRHKCLRNGWKTAVKVGRDWLISKNEPYAGYKIPMVRRDVRKRRTKKTDEK